MAFIASSFFKMGLAGKAGLIAAYLPSPLPSQARAGMGIDFSVCGTNLDREAENDWQREEGGEVRDLLPSLH